MVVACAVGCRREGAQPQPAAPDASPGAPSAIKPPPAPLLEDVVETTPTYVIGISYPPSAAKYPGLAAELKRYAQAARADLLQAVQARPAGSDAALYDLSISFTELLDTPALVAVAGDGSSYTGGAHGAPLIARFVWLPQQGKLLTATDLVPQARSWDAISANVREQLHTALSQRVDADALAPAERAEVVKNAGQMIDEGTQPDPKNFAMFEPVVTAAGKLRALRFVFAPYQVGPYSDGTQTVEVPAAVLLPHVAPAYRGLFEAG
ncbi:DUF3298 domain-containing protein [Lysobacter koreensis]|uniref:DUF3298 domain-containing protein n=1 Tax=Lysobacter koreensis TaxID=266122 RepID=A0ABW2YJ96_9GAMM